MNNTVKEIAKKLVRIIPTKMWLSWRFKKRVGYKMNWKDPKTFNQKLQWLKVYNRKEEYTQMVDKAEAKKYVAERIGEEYIVPTLGVFNKFDDINFDEMPQRFVIKCTHDSGGLVIVRDKTAFDKVKAKKKIEKALKANPYTVDREWPYKNVVPRIIVEEYMQDGNLQYLPVYKFFCFGGEATIIQTIQDDKTQNEAIDYFDREWNLLDLKQNFPNSKSPLKKPERFKEMLNIADLLSKGVDANFLRVDLYCINNKIYFSEFTFFSDSGMEKFTPNYWDEKLGDMINLPLDK